MEIELDPLSPVPLYQQVRDRIVELIAMGQLARGTGLASVRSLAGAFRINPATVAKGYDLLRTEGLVVSNAKSGTFIARGRDSEPAQAYFVTEWRQRLITLLAEGRAKGLTEADLISICREVTARLEAGASQGGM
ncbi:GntR family transcriptional regulator [Brooklawnia cerclae]|uniref:DNA-binding transcriptional regulator YhcF (GntR family) n=1 Tax=Brooklawnia cerclae TaxID=349934 RepID=A0ABX0SEC8_9ACTN|nr:DNA-binding transcriptional regulator YhcF (GntR family) [Brooklawnia cerclae]